MRTLDDVKTMIEHAKLNVNNLTGITQTIYFSSEVDESNDFKLLELNSHLSSAIEEGQTISFKGRMANCVAIL